MSYDKKTCTFTADEWLSFALTAESDLLYCRSEWEYRDIKSGIERLLNNACKVELGGSVITSNELLNQQQLKDRLNEKYNYPFLPF